MLKKLMVLCLSVAMACPLSSIALVDANQMDTEADVCVDFTDPSIEVRDFNSIDEFNAFLQSEDSDSEATSYDEVFKPGPMKRATMTTAIPTIPRNLGVSGGNVKDYYSIPTYDMYVYSYYRFYGKTQISLGFEAMSPASQSMYVEFYRYNPSGNDVLLSGSTLSTSTIKVYQNLDMGEQYYFKFTSRTSGQVTGYVNVG